MRFCLLLAALLFSFSFAALAVEPIVFDFEDGTQGWTLPDWAGDQKDVVGTSVEVTDEEACTGEKSLKLTADFPGNAWACAIAVCPKDMDLTGYKTITAKVLVPKRLRFDQIQARIIITAGPWYFIEPRSYIVTDKGKWSEVKVKLDVPVEDEFSYWKCKKHEECLQANLDRIRRIAIRIEYNAAPKNYGSKYNGPIYIDDVIIE